MKQFETNGGDFTPKGYLKINEGGSHEMNPNGGVQLGVDPNGVPNMVEEGESVYKDFVYSDRITINDDMIDSHNLPKQLKGKTYSDAADWFLSNMSSSYDAIENNGLNVGLSRLAQAQEEQKQLEEKKELEKELSQLSPEELDALEAALSDEQQPNEEPPTIMAEGGMLHSYYPGGVMGQGPLFVTPAFDDSDANVGHVEQIVLDDNTKAGRRIKQFQFNVKQVRNSKLMWDSAQNKYKSAAAERDSLKQAFMNAKTTEADAWKRAQDAVLSGGDLAAATRAYDAAIKDRKRLQKEYQAKKVEANNARVDATSLGYLYGRNLSTLFPKGPVHGIVPSTTPSGKESPIIFDDEPQGHKVIGSFSLDDLQPLALGGPINKYEKAGFLQKQAMPELPFFVADPTIMGKQFPGWDLSMTGKDSAELGLFPEGYEPHLITQSLPSTEPEVVVPPIVSPSMPAYSTIGMYAEPLLHGIEALHNLSQEPTKFTYNLPLPARVSSNMNLGRLSYMPEDINSEVNSVDAGNAGIESAVLNAGLGPSTGAVLLASLSQGARNRGEAVARSRRLAREGKNNVIQLNNQAEAMESQAALAAEQANAEALNRRNALAAQYDLLTQRLNDEAETAKYMAVSNELDALGAGLYSTGRGNFTMNQVNSNPALAYWVDKNGVAHYGACGGLLKKYKK